MEVVKNGTGKNAKEVASFNYTSKTKGLNWNVTSDTIVTTLGECDAESRKTKVVGDKGGDDYLRLTIEGKVYAQFEANFINAYVTANGLHPKEGEVVNVPMDAEFKLTPNGAEFKAN